MNYHKAGKSWTKAEIDREVNKEFSAPLLHQTNQGPIYFTKVGDIELRAPEWLIEDLVESGCLIYRSRGKFGHWKELPCA